MMLMLFILNVIKELIIDNPIESIIVIVLILVILLKKIFFRNRKEL